MSGIEVGALVHVEGDGLWRVEHVEPLPDGFGNTVVHLSQLDPQPG